MKLSKQPGSGGAVVRIEGRLDSSALHILAELLDSDPSSPPPSIDLSGLSSIDRAARDALIGLRQRGLRLAGGSLYINQLLQEIEP